MEEFLKQFEDYFEECTPLGVRIPEVNFETDILAKYGIGKFKNGSDLLRQLCNFEFKNKKINDFENSEDYKKRIKYELDTLDRLGFSNYILMVWDLLRWCDSKNIPRGFGRGSVAGSAVAWLLGITAVDPIKYGLLFERFLNETRVHSKIIDGEQYSDGGSVPDIDIDISYIHRDKVIYDYLENAYPNKTSHIATINTLSTKLVLKEVVKKFGGYGETEANRISNFIESNAGVLDSIDETVEKNDVFEEWVGNNPDLVKVAKKILDLPRNYGVHAAGITISIDNIFDTIPLEIKKDTENVERIISSYTKDDAAEEVIKLDILGLKTLDPLYLTAKEVSFNLDNFDLDSPEIYRFLENFENTYGIFQLDGDTATRVTKKVKPENFEDVSAISALARPGALSFLDDFVQARETGIIKSIYPPIDKILKETGGIILYQEQTMAVANQVYGFGLNETDTLRKDIGKKRIEKIKLWEDKIKEAGKEKNIPQEATDRFWKTVNDSAKYQFNKSHSISYAFLSVLCVYLKIHYPAHFFKNCLMLARTYQNSEARIQQIYSELPAFGIKLLPPDLILSDEDFKVEGNNIRYGLSSIKGVQKKTLEKLRGFRLDEKNRLLTFEAARESGININILVALIYAGCLDKFEVSRPRLVLECQAWNLLTESQKKKVLKVAPKYDYDVLKLLLAIKEGKIKDEDGKELISIKKRKTKSGGKSPMDTYYEKYLPFKNTYNEYKANEELFNYYHEVNVLGFAHSNTLQNILNKKYKNYLAISQIEDLPLNSNVMFGGFVQESRIGKTKKGGKMLTLNISDESGVMHCKAFNSEFFSRQERKYVQNYKVDEIQEINGKLPEKNDLVFCRGTKKDRVVFLETVKILKV